jgi:hypothetical protein
LAEMRALGRLRTNAIQNRTGVHHLINYRARIADELAQLSAMPWKLHAIEKAYGWRCAKRQGGVMEAWRYRREATRSRKLYGAIGKAAVMTCNAITEGLRRS